MLWDKSGITREVFIIGNYAIKIPSVRSWKGFLWGLLANMQEKVWWGCRDTRLCPVLFSLPSGFLAVMPKVKVMTDDEFDGFDHQTFINQPPYRIPVESKSDSFGWLDNEVVAIDYGS